MSRPIQRPVQSFAMFPRTTAKRSLFSPGFSPTSHAPHAESATDHAHCARHFAQFPPPATRHPGFRDGTSASSATGLNRARIAMRGGQGGGRLGKAAAGSGCLCQAKKRHHGGRFQKPLKASRSPCCTQRAADQSQKSPTDSAQEALGLLRRIRGRRPARETSCLELRQSRHRSPLSAVAGWQSWP